MRFPLRNPDFVPEKPVVGAWLVGDAVFSHDTQQPVQENKKRHMIRVVIEDRVAREDPSRGV